jgi:hypothetical protein
MTAGTALTHIIHGLSQPGEAWLKNILNAMDYWNCDEDIERILRTFVAMPAVARNGL